MLNKSSSLMLLALMASPVLAQGTYMGKAATGEPVYYQGANFQCGDLPRSDQCWWRTPMISYTIGSDNVSAIADCQTMIFREVWVGNTLVNRNLRPQSEALRLMLQKACRR